MDAEDFELAVTAIIPLRRVSNRRFKKPLESNGFALYLKRGKRMGHITNLNEIELNDLEFSFK